MRIREDHAGFPFRTIRMIGWALLILGIIVMILGIVDLGWTAGNYASVNCDAALDWDPMLEYPCDHADLVWTWVSAPVWASLFVVVTGIIGTRFSRFSTDNLRFHRDLFTVMCVLCCLLWGPAIIIICSLECYNQLDLFYYVDASSTLQVEDAAKLALPILCILITFFWWLVAIAGVCVGCCCAPIADDEYDTYPRVHTSSRRGPPMMGPPIIMPPSTGAYPGYNYGAYPTYGGSSGYYGGASNGIYGGASNGAYGGASNGIYGGASYGGASNGLFGGGFGGGSAGAMMPYSGGAYSTYGGMAGPY